MGVNYGELAVKLAREYRGKVSVYPRVPVRGVKDFAIWYTPGVAEVSRRIFRDPDLSFDLTGRWNTIAIVTDGTRVLGLGDFGPEAAMAVMEGKALLFNYLGGVDAVPLPVSARRLDDLVRLVEWLRPAFGGVNLEDIESPKCFFLLDELRKRLDIPVWHDDQQGTAGVTLSALINALKLTGRKLRGSTIAFIGAGAANIATLRLLVSAGADPKDFVVVDSKGILHPARPDMEKLKEAHPWKYWIAHNTNRDGRTGGIKEAIEGADVLIAASKPQPGLIKKEWIRSMADDPIVFALANPDPEIWPWDAKEAGARIVATGRSDFPNQVNNSLVFPSVFRGALDARSRKITDSMIIAAAEELARYAEERGLSEDYIVPRMTDWEAYPRVAAAVAVKAWEEGVARVRLTWEEEYENAKEIISSRRKALEMFVEAGLVKISPLLEEVPAE